MSNLTTGKLLIPFSRLPRKKLTRFTGPQGRIDLIRKTVTSLIKTERYIRKFRKKRKDLIVILIKN
jgi:hypothetical protein